MPDVGDIRFYIIEQANVCLPPSCQVPLLAHGLAWESLGRADVENDWGGWKPCFSAARLLNVRFRRGAKVS